MWLWNEKVKFRIVQRSTEEVCVNRVKEFYVEAAAYIGFPFGYADWNKTGEFNTLLEAEEAIKKQKDTIKKAFDFRKRIKIVKEVK